MYRRVDEIFYQFSSVPQSCPTLCNRMDCSMPGFPVHHQLPESAQTHSVMSSSIRWCHPTISPSVAPFFSCLWSFPASGSFLVSQFFASSDQSIGALVSASVHPMNSQYWFPLGLAGLISLQSKGLSLTDMHLRFLYVFSWLESSFLFSVEYYFIFWMHSSLPTEGHLHCLQVSSVMNKSAINIHVHIFA